MSVLFRGAEVDGSLVDVLVQGAHVADVGPRLDGHTELVVDARGGALLPGLHDHHLHLLAMAAAKASVDCSTVAGLESIASAPGSGWVRGTGYHESVAGSLDRHGLDRLTRSRPVRVQHRSGGLWMLNSAALDRVAGALGSDRDVERDERGEPTGRLWRYDDRLRPFLPSDPPDLRQVASELSAYGLTGVTDATPDLGADAVAMIARDVSPRFSVTLLGTAGDLPRGMRQGPMKLLLRDHDLPTFPELLETVARHHEDGRPTAIHCVTRESLVLTLAVLKEAGTVPGDRIEHAAVVPSGMAADLAALGVAVVTQPSLLRLRGDDYVREVDPEDVGCLYPFGGLLRAGVRVSASSDAPYGDPDPWRTIADAVHRRTRTGLVIGGDEKVQAAVALQGYLSASDDPGGPPRRVTSGGAADLVLLHAPLAEALRSPSSEQVRLVMYRGDLEPGR